MVQTRKTEFDLCRIMACLVVILSHASGDGFHMALLGTRRFWALCLASTLGRSSIPLFFMLSGALLLSRERMDPWQNLKKRVAHMLGLFFVWSLAYALMRAVTGAFESFYDFAYAMVLGHYHLWFLPAMALVYLFMPVVHAAIHGNRMDPRYLLFLFLFGIIAAYQAIRAWIVRNKILAMILTFLAMTSFTLVVIILGYLYISAGFHDLIMEKLAQNEKKQQSGPPPRAF